jgi:hypothetical protein
MDIAPFFSVSSLFFFFSREKKFGKKNQKKTLENLGCPFFCQKNVAEKMFVFSGERGKFFFRGELFYFSSQKT